MDDRLRRLEHLVRSDPLDPGARGRLRAELRRVADVHERDRWRAAGAAAQDLVAQVVGRLLAPDLEPLPDAGTYAAGGQEHRVPALRHRATGVVLHLLPGGRFARRAAGHEALVRVPAFLVGRYPVRQAEWDRVGGDDERSWEGPDLPIEGVSWLEVTEWLERAGGGLRLPTEAEWEYACRAGTTSTYFWGDRVDARFAWFGTPAAEWRTHAVAEHDAWPNAFGLVDVVGNVSEWCQDAFAPYDARTPTDGSAARRRGRLRVVRGGDGFNPASHCRSAYRNGIHLADRGAGIGFRVARSIPV